MKVGIKTYTDEVGYKYLPKIIEFVDFIEILPVPTIITTRASRTLTFLSGFTRPTRDLAQTPGDKKAVENKALHKCCKGCC